MKLILAKCAVYAAIALAPMPGTAHAYYSTGNKLYAECISREGMFGKAYCLGFIVGAADAMEYARVIYLDQEPCWPKGVTQGQLQDVVVKYLADHPEERHKSAFTNIGSALIQAFCPKE